MWKKAIIALALLGLTLPAGAQTWDATKPVTSSLLVSADVRSNWTALQQTVGTTNLLADPTFLIWQAGDAAVGAHWSLSGAGAAIARSGTGLGDTTRKVGDFCAKLTSAAATLTLQQQLLPTAAFTRASFLQSQSVSAGSWLKTSTASAAQICIFDGVGSTCSSFHTGGGAFEWLTVTRVLNVAATELTFRATVTATSLTAYVSGPTVILGPVPPSYSQPAPVRFDTMRFHMYGALTVAADKWRWSNSRPGIVKDVQLEAVGANVTSAFVVDVKTWDGAALTSMFTTKPQIAVAAKSGDAIPDTTYARRCFTGGFGTGLTAGAFGSMDVSSWGGTGLSDMDVSIRYLTYDRPLEQFLDYNSVN